MNGLCLLSLENSLGCEVFKYLNTEESGTLAVHCGSADVPESFANLLFGLSGTLGLDFPLCLASGGGACAIV
jgi:hypothetical protein